MLPELSSQRASFLEPNPRFFVPDLSPEARIELKQASPRWIFVAESPHLNEIEPEQVAQRRPLCGMAGLQWWGMLTEILEGKANSDVSLPHLIDLCRKYGIVVMNAVQYPLDPKITNKVPAADPVLNLGFNKVSGAFSFKKLKASQSVLQSIDSLKARLSHSSVKNLPIHCLGNDAEWFVLKAADSKDLLMRVGEKIPHPSAWWRKGGLFGRVARERLEKVLKSE